MTRKPSVSVLMAVHNGGQFLRAAVESILTQTLTDLEFIIIDDGSTDDTAGILAEYSARDPRVQLTLQQPSGLTRSLNNGLQMVRSEYVARMDADDISLPGRLERQLAFVRAYPQCACVGSAVIYIDEKGRKLFVRRMPQTHDEIVDAHSMDYGSMIVHPTAVVRMDALEWAGGYSADLRYAQDYDLWCRLASRYELANLREPLLLYRWHQTAITQRERAEQTTCTRQVLMRELKLRGRSVPVPIPSEFESMVRMSDPRWVSKAARRDGFYQSALRFSAKRLKSAGVELVRAIQGLVSNAFLLAYDWAARGFALRKRHRVP